jgi:cysteine dioxygenase
MISEISSIEQLNHNLTLGPGYGGYIEILKAIEIPESEWKQFCKWSDDHYTRNCLSNCDAFELILMCWQSGQHSAIHSYSFQQGWIKVLKGELTIETYRIDRESLSCEQDESIVIKEGQYTYLNDSMGFHKVSATSEGETVSLHLHAERVKEWEVFHDCKKEFSKVKTSYDSKTANCSE